METLLLIKGLYKKPFRYSKAVAIIFDSNDKVVLYINRDRIEPYNVVGEYVTKLLNDNYEE